MNTRALDSLPDPRKIVCVGLNYRDHAAESGLELPQQPVVFAKWTSAIIGPGEPIVLPACSKQIDYEAELAVIIGLGGRHIREEAALATVAGYTCLNDVTARDVQFADGQWTRAKSFDTFCPLGPELVPGDVVGDPQNLRVRCFLNGECVQDSNTANMVFSIPYLIAYISREITLEPGDVIATGTPAGVAYARERYLQPGDVVAVEIERVGTLENPVRGPEP